MKTSILFGLSLTVCIGASASCPPTVDAGMVQTISSHNGPTRQTNPIPISLAPGAGVTLNFTPAGETIKKVWLDNPSFVVMDADGCLSGLPASGGDCQGSNASLINLRRIKDLPIPGLPKTNQSLLTVVTNGNGGTNLYLFRITKAHQPHKLVFEIVPNRPPSVREPLVLTTHRMTRGLKVALDQKLLTNESTLTQQIHQFIGYLESGFPKTEAATKAGISTAVVLKLERLGR